MRLEFAETRKQSLFSRRLLQAIDERLKAGEQVMVLLNRRGFSTYVACRACGERIECRNCSVTLTYHRREQRLLCHYCDYAEPVPKLCPKCGGEYIYFLGSGSEKVEEHLHEAFPRARIARLDRDAARGKKQYEAILSAFRERSFDILVGTQMIAKGHDIPNVTLVGVVSADQGLGLPDFRAAERTFQLLTQVAGRAGRGDLPGLVLVQTLEPDHYTIRFSQAHNYSGFYEKELNFRRAMHYPPFAALANVLIRSEKLDDALRLSAALGEYLKKPPSTIRVLGPAAASLVRLKSEYRYQFLIKSSSRRDLAQLLKGARHFVEESKWPATALAIDVDPLTLM
jgi:primosomal protein N' (replication factor Y)